MSPSAALVVRRAQHHAGVQTQSDAGLDSFPHDDAVGMRQRQSRADSRAGVDLRTRSRLRHHRDEPRGNAEAVLAQRACATVGDHRRVVREHERQKPLPMLAERGGVRAQQSQKGHSVILDRVLLFPTGVD